MRILMVSNYFPEHVGGIETVADNLARGYRARGHVVRWLAVETTVEHRGHPDDLPLRAWNITEERFGFPYPILSRRAVARLISEAANCDVIHLHDCLYLASVVAALAGRARRKPVLITQHIAIVPYRRRLLRWLQRAAYATLGRLVLQRASRVVFVSKSVSDWFAPRLRPNQLPALIANGIDAAVFKPFDADRRQQIRRELQLPEGTPVLLFSGRFVEKKGLHLLSEIAAGEPRWSWVIIGRTGDVDPAAWGQANVQVRPPMSQAELARYYAAADLLVLPSTGEGFPVAVQEAMACGTPVVVSEEVRAEFADAPAFSSERDSKAIRIAISGALNAGAADPRLRERVATYAAERWNWSAVVDRYEAALMDLISPAEPSVRVAA